MTQRVSQPTSSFDPDEVEQLLSRNEEKETRINMIEVAPKQTAKLSAMSFYGIIAICIGTTMYGSLGILARLSMSDDHTLPYNTNSVLVISEICKFCITFSLLFYLEGISKAIKSIKDVPFSEWFLFSVPAIIYSIANNLDFYIVQYMDPGSFNVLSQTKIITTALLWWLWFGNKIDRQQWVSLLLLCAGSMSVAWPNNNNDDDDDNTNQNKMYVEWPMGPLLISILVCLSATAGIYTEWVYKKYGKGRSMHIDNLSMYFWGFLSNILQAQFGRFNETKEQEIAENRSIFDLFDGFNKYTWMLVIVYCGLGISVAYVMKYFDNIVKLFMSGFSIIVSGILTFIIFGLNWTITYCIGLICVTSAVFLYKSPKKWI